MALKIDLAAAAALTAFSIAALVTEARAHATFENAEVTPAKTHKAVLRVPHGCDGQATHTVRIAIPDGIIGVKPMPKAGWDLTTAEGAYTKAYSLWDKPVEKGVKEIVWSKGNLPDGQYDEFVFQMVVAGEQPAAELALPVVQECASGRVAWTEIAAPGVDPHSLKHPAPVLKVQLAQANSHAGHGAPMRVTAPMLKTWKAGAMVIEAAWTRATPGGAKVGGGFLTLKNTGAESDRLIKFETAIAERAELHEMAVNNGVMTMREMKALEIKPGETVQLKPGSYHLMLMDLKNPIQQGAPVKGTLTFEKAGKVEVEFDVAPIGAAGLDGKAAPATGHKH